ncbi:hypothetical protein [Arthrobacter sp. ISL-28]|uniref:hypothetical protein n=1 Tax=Arthrobacter sp. ISL-28 TaxID=2819108 RepID=UPI001BEB5C04|nr:hypothetical protein [Arthrobacter sp. ISL-28]MBT2523047.1 hypothetical protein [Arthrobacter sp. ISL-28]
MMELSGFAAAEREHYLPGRDYLIKGVSGDFFSSLSAAGKRSLKVRLHSDLDVAAF